MGRLTKERIEGVVREVCRRLKEVDPGIRAVVQFGSSVYAPDLAEDIDLLVLSEAPRPIGVYLAAVEGAPIPVHIVPAKAGRKLEPFLAASVRAWGRVVAGDPLAVEEAVRGVPPPSLEEVEEALLTAEASVKRAQTEEAEAVQFLLRMGAQSLLEAVKKGDAIALCSREGLKAERALMRDFEGIVRALRPMINGRCAPRDDARRLALLLSRARRLFALAKSRGLRGGRIEG